MRKKLFTDSGYALIMNTIKQPNNNKSGGNNNEAKKNYCYFGYGFGSRSCGWFVRRMR